MTAAETRLEASCNAQFGPEYVLLSVKEQVVHGPRVFMQFASPTIHTPAKEALYPLRCESDPGDLDAMSITTDQESAAHSIPSETALIKRLRCVLRPQARRRQQQQSPTAYLNKAAGDFFALEPRLELTRQQLSQLSTDAAVVPVLARPVLAQLRPATTQRVALVLSRSSSSISEPTRSLTSFARRSLSAQRSRANRRNLRACC